jgi:hypothetical protein
MLRIPGLSLRHSKSWSRLRFHTEQNASYDCIGLLRRAARAGLRASNASGVPDGGPAPGRFDDAIGPWRHVDGVA